MQIITNKTIKKASILARHLGSLDKLGFNNHNSDLALIIGLVGMNFHAKYYSHWDLAYTKDLSYARNWSPQDICQYCQKYGLLNIVLAYTEPLLSLEFILKLSKKVSQNNLNIYISTNGLFPLKTLALLKDKINIKKLQINLHSVSNHFYRRLASIDVAIVKRFCRQARQYNIPISINSLIIDQENDDETDLQKLAEFIYNLGLHTSWRLEAYQPAYKLLDKRKTPLSTMKKALQIGKGVGLTNVHFV